MRRLVDRLRSRWQEGRGARRAIAESLADWQFEAGRATAVRAHLAAALAAILACVRVLIRALPGLPGEALFRNAGRDFRYAGRRLSAAPIFTLFSIVSLALGIGGATAAYSAVRAATGPPPGIADVDRLVRIRHTRMGSLPIIGLSWGDYEDLRARQTVFDGLAAWDLRFTDPLIANGHSLTGVVESVSGDYFGTLGVSTTLGRPLHRTDDSAGAPAVAVISHGVWQRLFKSAPSTVGRWIKIRGVSVQVVGVASSSFSGMVNGGLTPTIAWVPFNTKRLIDGPASTTFDSTERDRRWLLLAARLAPGRTLEEAMAQVGSIAKQLDVESPIGQDLHNTRVRPPYATSRPWDVQSLAGRVEATAGGMWINWVGRALVAAVAVVLLIACTNLANLMFARSVRRRHEFAVRLALGATRWRLVREALAEAVILAGIGGIAGLAVARVLIHGLSADLSMDGGRFFLRLAPQLDTTVLAACAAATAIALLASGLVPALRSARADARAVLTAESGAIAGRWRGRRLLIVLQVGVSAVLLSLATLSLVQVRAVTRIDSGFDDERVAVMEVNFQAHQYDEARTRHVVDAVLGRMSNHPEVTAAAASSGLPSGIPAPAGRVGLMDGSLSTITRLVTATPTIFDTLGIEILRGRAFDDRDLAGQPAVAVVSRSLALGLFNTVDVVGRTVTFQRQRSADQPTPATLELTIVGVGASPDATEAGSPDWRIIYLPWAQSYDGRVVFSARTFTDPTMVLGSLREALRAVDPEVATTRVAAAGTLGDANTLFPRITAMISSVLGSLALVLALAGLYGVLAHLIAGRTREIGIRLALGASAARIRRQVLLQGMDSVLLGLVAGQSLVVLLVIAVPPAFVRLMPALDFAALLAVPVLFIAAGLAACYLPALRASRVDPNVALRSL